MIGSSGGDYTLYLLGYNYEMLWITYTIYNPSFLYTCLTFFTQQQIDNHSYIL